MSRSPDRDTAGRKIPPSLYLSEFKTIVVNFLSQPRWRKSGNEDNSRWRNHLILMSGYVTKLVLIVPLLWWLQTDEPYPLHHPQRWVGYLATLALVYASGESLLGRWRKRVELHRHSPPADWLLPAFILIGPVSGMLVRILRSAGRAWPTYLF
jgi:hypothetical protein